MIETERTNKTRLGNSIVQQNKLRKEYFQKVTVIKEKKNGNERKMNVEVKIAINGKQETKIIF